MFGRPVNRDAYPIIEADIFSLTYELWIIVYVIVYVIDSKNNFKSPNF